MIPLGGVRVALVSFDRDSLRRAVEADATSPRPNTDQLDSLFQRFRGPYQQVLELARARDDLRDRIREGNSSAIADSLAPVEQAYADADRVLAETRRQLQPQIEALRKSLRAWDRTVAPQFDSLSSQLARGRRPIIDSTDATGWTHFEIPPGPWWVVAWVLNPNDPNSQWYWNLPLTGDTLHLTNATGHLRPRY